MKTVILAKYELGYVEVSTGSGYTRTYFLDFGRTKSYAAVTAACQAKLTELTGVRESITVSVEPTSGNVPLVDVNLGDAVRSYGRTGSLDTYRLVGVNTQTDSNGFAKQTPTLNSQANEYTAQFQRWLEALNSGTLNGRATMAQPTQDVLAGIPTGAVNPPSIPPFDYPGNLVGVRQSSPWQVDDYCIVLYGIANLSVAATGDIWMQAYLNGTTFLADIIPAGTTRYRSGNGTLNLLPGDLYILSANSLAGNGSSLTYQMQAAPLWLYESTT